MTFTKEIALELPNIIKIYKDGTREFPMMSPEPVTVPPSPQDPETGVSSKDITIPHPQNPNILARLYLPNLPPNEIQKIPILVYLPGSAFCIKCAIRPNFHRFLNRLVSEAKVLAVFVQYRVAPEYPLPAAYQDAWAALQWVASHSSNKQYDGPKEPWLVNHGDFDKFYIGGDSSGGNVVHNTAMRVGIEGLFGGVKILGAYLSHPYFWGSKPIGSELKCEVLETTLPYKLWDFVYPSAPGGLDNPRINPMGEGAPSLARLGCSKVLVCVGGKDELRDRDILYYNLVKESGWKGELELFEEEGAGHCTHFYKLENEEGKKMIKCLASFLV